jgi:maltose alpha-D-glucosyltransferase/alpha-amylase
MGFHFPQMPRIFMALRKGDRSPLVWILDRTPPIPDECQWCTFLRNHDELTLEMVTEEERQWMWQEYAPQARMRLNQGIRRRLAPLLDNDPRKIELANSLLFSLPGSPVLYYGDEIGMGDNIWLPDRNGVRTPMQWNSESNAGFSNAPPSRFYSPLVDDQAFSPASVNVAAQRADSGSLWNAVRRMITVRKEHPAFGHGNFRWAETGSNAVAAYWRDFQGSRLLILNNLSAAPQGSVVALPGEQYLSATDLFSDFILPLDQKETMNIELGPYQYRWLKIITTAPSQ